MGSGVKFTVDAAFASGLLIPDDPRLNAGSLMLLEPARDGLIAVPSSLRNYAADQFESVSGDRVESILVTDALTGVAKCKAELTAKGGLHGIVSTDALAGAIRARLAGTTPQELFEYLIANPSHSYYFGMIGRVTRATGAVDEYASVALGGLSPSTDYIAGTSSNYGFGVAQSSSSGNVAGAPDPNGTYYTNRRVDANQPYFADVAVSGHTLTTLATVQSQGRGEIFTMGERINTTDKFGWPSHILYTLWLEDLTVSGRTYSQASSEGLSIYNARFSDGGQYHGDTFTAPSAVP